MFDIGALLLRLALPLVLLWTAASIATAFAFERVASGSPAHDERVGLEAWLLYAGMGAAAGGLVGTMFVLRDLATLAPKDGDIGRLLLFATPGMVLGAAFACSVVAAAFHLRR